MDAKDDLEETLSTVYQLGGRLIDRGRELISAGQNIQDAVELTRDAIPMIMSPDQLSMLTASWKRTCECASNTVEGIERIDMGTVSATTTASVMTSLATLWHAQRSTFSFSGTIESDQRLDSRLTEYLQKTRDADEVVKLLRSLLLTSASPQTRSPIEQFQTAMNAFDITVDETVPALTSLIPIRECILQVVSSFLKQRPDQQKTRNIDSKVRSILNQLKRDDVPDALIDELATKARDILDEQLSTSKNAKMERQQWLHALSVSVLWLKAFLESIDPTKLRLPAT